MITRTTSVSDIEQAIVGCEDMLTAFHPEQWLADDQNIALISSSKDVSLFQRLLPSVVIGHFFYHSRGKEAIVTATDMLAEIFTGPYNVHVIEGLPPLQNLGSRWLSKKIGFKSHGVTETVSGPCEIVILTKDEWRVLHG